jgi:hypothetical protein
MHGDGVWNFSCCRQLRTITAENLEEIELQTSKQRIKSAKFQKLDTPWDRDHAFDRPSLRIEHNSAIFPGLVWETDTSLVQ